MSSLNVSHMGGKVAHQGWGGRGRQRASMARREMTGLHTAREQHVSQPSKPQTKLSPVEALTLHRAHSHRLALSTGVLSHTHNSSGISTVF